MTEKILNFILIAFFSIIIFAGFVAYAGWAYSYAWNMIMPSKFGLPTLTVLQAGFIYYLIQHTQYIAIMKKEYVDSNKQAIHILLKPIALVAFAYILKPYI